MESGTNYFWDGKEVPIQTGGRSIIIPQFEDPVEFFHSYWPQHILYEKQKEILYSVRDNFETIVPAGNQLGKDFIAAVCIIWFLVSRRPSRIATTSVNASQLEDVLWSEIRSFLETSAAPLPIEIIHGQLFQTDDQGNRVPKCHAVAKVVQKEEGMLGLHADRTPKNEPTTMLVVDEASGVADGPYDKADTWAHRKLVIGNPFPCTNFFWRGTKEGDLESVKGDGSEILQRKVIKIKAEDSPNVQLGLEQKKNGLPITHEVLIPGIITYATYLQRRATYDKIKQCISLDAEFYEGGETLMFPPDWLNNSETNWGSVPSQRKALGIGIDPAEGGDSTAFAAVDEWGLIKIQSIKTPDTSMITSQTLAFMREVGLNPDNKMDCLKVCFDRGGGGKQHADRMRKNGYDVSTVGFGEAATKPPKTAKSTLKDRKQQDEQRYAYRNKRAEMYGRLRLRMNPTDADTRFYYPPDLTELRKQLSPIPLTYDEEGRIKLPPKNKRTANSTEITLVELIGHSPDEADAVVLAVYAMEVLAKRPKAGALL